MKSSTSIVIAFATAAGLGLAIAAAFAHPGDTGPGMMHGMHAQAGGFRGPMRGAAMGSHMAGHMANASGDAAFGADMNLVHNMLQGNDKIKRTVTNLPDGIRTLTESDEPQVAQSIKAHVASMERRLTEGREFNLFSSTIPVLFANRDKIKTVVEMTDGGVIVTQTSADAKVVAALQAHAVEVSELARGGMAAMMRNMRANMMGRM